MLDGNIIAGMYKAIDYSLTDSLNRYLRDFIPMNPIRSAP